MDIFHTGKEDASGDHKFVNERLLEVAIPEPAEGKTITLESCLESYFNNRIEVKRYLTRHDTLSSMDSVDSVSKDFATHIESVEVGSSTSSSPNASSPHVGQVTPLSSLRDSNESSSTLVNKPRRSSIVRERFIPDSDDIESDKNSPRASQDQSRKGSYRKEVMMPAWQFFNLIRKSPSLSFPGFSGTDCYSVVHRQHTDRRCAGCDPFLFAEADTWNVFKALLHVFKWQGD